MRIISFLENKIAEAGSQTAVSRKTGVSQGTLSKIILGDTKPTLETIQKIATAYNLPVSTFIDDNLKDQVSAETNKVLATMAASGVDPVQAAYLKWFASLTIEEQHQIYLNKSYVIGGIPKNLKE
jgi:transcriptional regulator with XRE-family HTH domain